MSSTRNITVHQALEMQKQGAQILDVRTPQEWSQGVARDSQMLSLTDIQNHQLESLHSDRSYLLICRSGVRSLQALSLLSEQGYENLYNVEGGFNQWSERSLPTEIPDIDRNELRYQRHYQLQGFGREAQKKLSSAHVLMIGVGGLGSSAAYYLAAAGVGELTLVDDDEVSLNNLQRQIIHSTQTLFTAKVESAKEQLHRLNPDIKINTIKSRLREDNAKHLISSCDVVVDGSDNLDTRYLVNDICFRYSKKLIYAAVFEYEAQLTSFDFSEKDSPCLRCLFPQTEGFEPANCSTVGVLGVVPGMAGVMQATEAIKAITGTGSLFTETLQVINLLDNSFYSFTYKTDPNCKNSH